LDAFSDAIQLLKQLPQHALLCDQHWRIVAQTHRLTDAWFGRSYVGLPCAEIFDATSVDALRRTILLSASAGTSEADLEHPLTLRLRFQDRMMKDPSLGRNVEHSVDQPVMHERLQWTQASAQVVELKLAAASGFWIAFDLASATSDTHHAAISASMRQMTRAFAHEIRNPLSGLRGTAQLLSRMHPELHSYTQILIQESDRLVRLIDRLSQQQRFEPKPCNIHAPIENVRRLTTAQFPDIEWQCDYDPSVPELAVDADAITQALLNLCLNAAQAKARTVGLRTRIEHGVTTPSRWLRSALRIDVTDNGQGVPESVRDSLFLPLVTARAESGGSGFGLAQVLAVAEEHGGHVRYRSAPGDTCFSLYLPMQPIPSTDSTNP
jgi:nitrogen-specific signal transduction histidine kinase